MAKVTLENFSGVLGRFRERLNDSAGIGKTRAAEKSVRIVRADMPIAFGELEHSITAMGDTLSVTAPHAAAVEAGSRPHLVPIEDLVAWVKLRGMQGIGPKRGLRGNTTAGHAAAIAGELKGNTRRSGTSRRGNQGLYNDVNDPLEIALRIQKAIAKNGTKPHWFVRTKLPQMLELLGKEVLRAIKRR